MVQKANPIDSHENQLSSDYLQFKDTGYREAIADS